jgi:ketopantoate reductase
LGSLGIDTTSEAGLLYALQEDCMDIGILETLNEQELRNLSDYVHAVMEEITMLGKKKGVDLPADIVAASYEHGRDFAYKTKTSFQRDFEQADRPDERDLLAGTILRLGGQLGIETPVTQELWQLMERRKPC